MRRQAYDLENTRNKGRGKRKLSPTVGDVVMVNPKEKWDNAKYGIIEKIKSDQTVVVRFKGAKQGTITPTRLIIPLSARCLVGGKPADIVEAKLSAYAAHAE